MKSALNDGAISMALSEDEALVLLEWLHRFNEEERPALFEHQAEERVLFDLEAALEDVVQGTFEGDYNSVLSKARERLKDRD